MFVDLQDRLKLRLHVASLGAKPSNKVRLALIKKRSQLQNRINEFCDQAVKFIPERFHQSISKGPDATAGDSEFLSLLEEDPDIPTPFTPPKVVAENQFLPFPSTVGVDTLTTAGLDSLVKKELILRKGQANDCLQGVRTHLGEKSFLFRHDLRLADSKVRKTKAWTRLSTVNQKLHKERWVYEKARLAMMQLGASSTDLELYRPLTREDTRVSTAIMKPNQPGQRDASLAWFWTISKPSEGVDGDILREGKFIQFLRTHRRFQQVFCQFIEFIGCV